MRQALQEITAAAAGGALHRSKGEASALTPQLSRQVWLSLEDQWLVLLPVLYHSAMQVGSKYPLLRCLNSVVTLPQRFGSLYSSNLEMLTCIPSRDPQLHTPQNAHRRFIWWQPWKKGCLTED